MTQSIKKQLQAMKVLHLAFIAGLIMFALAGYFVGPLGVSAEFGQTLLYAAIGFGLIGLSTGTFLFKKMLTKIPSDAALDKKLETYRTAWILKIALLEGPALLSLVAFLLSGAWLFLIVAGVMVALMAMAAPTASRISSELELERSESIELEEASI